MASEEGQRRLMQDVLAYTGTTYEALTVTTGSLMIRGNVTVPTSSVNSPMTLDEYTALPEIETALCPECKYPGLFLGMIGVCNDHDEPIWWRWPGVVGMD